MIYEKKRLRLHQPATYQIRVQGTLPVRWGDYVQGMDIAIECDNEECPVAMLSGTLLDQAALLGVLTFLYDHHLPILTVDTLSTCEGTVD